MGDTQYKLDLNTVRRSWIAEHKPVVLSHAQTVEEFTTDDLHPLFHVEPKVPNWIGCMMRQLAHSKHIRRTGYRQSKRPVSNGRTIAVWKRTER